MTLLLLPQVIEQASVFFDIVPVLDFRRSANCFSVQKRMPMLERNEFNAYCLPTNPKDDLIVNPSLTRAGKIDCMGLRQCDIEVDLAHFESVLRRNVMRVLSTKYRYEYSDSCREL